jgi:hypothetical protein
VDALLTTVRLYIYAQMVDTSAAPSVAETARVLSLPPADIEAAYHALADRHIIVLRPNSHTIWMAMPFSNMQTAFTVIAGGRAYYANCAWDALGVPALLHADARIFTTCADCGDALERKVSNGELTETRGLVHFALPARRWWDNVGFT